MYGTLKKIFAFAGSKKGLLKKSLLFSFLSGLFSAMQFAALFVVIGALVSDNRDGKFICISLGIMAVSLIGRIITTYFSTMEQTETGYCMVAEKRIHIGDRLRYIPMGYFNKNTDVRHHALLQHDLTLQQAHAQLRIDTSHLVSAPTGNGLLLIGQVAAVFIAEEQAKLLFVDGVSMILVPLPPNVAHRVVCAPENHHRVMLYDKVCNLLHHALSSSFFLFC